MTLRCSFTGTFLAYSLGLLMPAAVAEPAVTPEMAQTARMLMVRAQESNEAYRLVASLTTEVGPRLAGTPSEARARDWATRALTKLGFDRVAVEPFDMPLWQRGVERAEILSPFPQPLTVTTLSPCVSLISSPSMPGKP